MIAGGSVWDPDLAVVRTQDSWGEDARSETAMSLEPRRLRLSFDFLRLLASHSTVEQRTIENMVAAATPDQRKAMRSEAEAALIQVNSQAAQRLLFHGEQQTAERAIELLVCMDAIEKGKGWWFRFKRRIQLTQSYLGEVPRPSGAKSDANDEAIRLMIFTDVVLTKYLCMSESDLKATLPLDFPSGNYGFDLDAATFVFPASPDFYFTISENCGSKSLCITGRRQYGGFTLFVPVRGYWHCVAIDRTGRSEPSEAKALAQLLEKSSAFETFQLMSTADADDITAEARHMHAKTSHY